MTRRNVYQVSDWNGISGERWVSNQARLDVMLAPFGDAALEAAAPQAGERVLDVGCGAGTQTFEIGRQVGPRGHVLALDISTPLVERARQTMPSNLPVTFDVADVSVAPLPVQALDLLYSRFGVMFFDDPVAAFSHMRLSLRPGGRLAFVCWRSAAENDWVRLPMGAIKGIVPPSAPPPAARRRAGAVLVRRSRAGGRHSRRGGLRGMSDASLRSHHPFRPGREP